MESLSLSAPEHCYFAPQEGEKSSDSKMAETALLDVYAHTTKDGALVAPSVMIAQKLRALVPESARKKKTFSSSKIEAVLSLHCIQELHNLFLKEGGPYRAVPFARFVDVVQQLLVEVLPQAVNWDAVGVEVKRWALSFAVKAQLVEKTVRSGGAKGAAASAISLGSEMLQQKSAKEIGGDLAITWGDVTTKLITDAQQKTLVEDFVGEYRPVPTVVPLPELKHQRVVSCCAVGDVSGYLVTGGSDGLVKLWARPSDLMDTGGKTGFEFQRTLYNGGFSWVCGVSFLHSEETLAIASSNSQLTVMEPSTGSILRKYVGSASAAGVPREVAVYSTVHTQKYGMIPGQSGYRQLHISHIEELTQEQFNHKRRQAWGAPQNQFVQATPLINFLDPSTFWYIQEHHMCCFGGTAGHVGIFDITEDVKRKIGGASDKPIEMLGHGRPHVDLVSSIRYASRYHVLLSGSLDGRIMKINLDRGIKSAIQHNTVHLTDSDVDAGPVMCDRPILGLDWCEKYQMLTSFGSDKRARLWSLLRPEPLHTFEPMLNDVTSVAVEANQDQLAMACSDNTIRLYDLRTFRQLQLIDLSDKKQIGRKDEGGCVSFCRSRWGTRLISVIHRPILFESMKVDTSKTKLVAGHKMPVVASLLNEQSRMLYTFDATTMYVWDLLTGESVLVINVAKQIDRILLAGDSGEGSHQLISCACWESKNCSKVLTGTQQSCTIEWNPLDGNPLRMDVLGREGDEISVMFEGHGIRITCVGTALHLSFSEQLFNHTLEKCPTFIDLEECSTNNPTKKGSGTQHSTMTITAACVLANNVIVVGCTSGTCHFFSLETGSRFELAIGPPQGSRRSVEVLHWFNGAQQSLLLIILESGLAAVFNVREKRLVGRLLLLPPERHLSVFSSCVTRLEDFLFIGDNIGVVYLFDVITLSAFAPPNVSKISLIRFFQACTEGIVSIHNCEELNCFVCCSSDCSARIFKMDGNLIQHIGNFGADTWDMNRPSTFVKEPLQMMQVVEVNEEGDNFLDEILGAKKRRAGSRVWKRNSLKQRRSMHCGSSLTDYFSDPTPLMFEFSQFPIANLFETRTTASNTRKSSLEKRKEKEDEGAKDVFLTELDHGVCQNSCIEDETKPQTIKRPCPPPLPLERVLATSVLQKMAERLDRSGRERNVMRFSNIRGVKVPKQPHTARLFKEFVAEQKLSEVEPTEQERARQMTVEDTIRIYRSKRRGQVKRSLAHLTGRLELAKFENVKAPENK